LRLEPLAAARLARQDDVRQELHLGRDDALSLADLTAAARHVEREVPRIESRDPRATRRREDPPDLVVALHVGDGVAARGAPDRRLIDHHDVAQPVRAAQLAVRARAPRGLLVAATLRAQESR